MTRHVSIGRWRRWLWGSLLGIGLLACTVTDASAHHGRGFRYYNPNTGVRFSRGVVYGPGYHAARFRYSGPNVTIYGGHGYRGYRGYGYGGYGGYYHGYPRW